MCKLYDPDILFTHFSVKVFGLNQSLRPSRAYERSGEAVAGRFLFFFSVSPRFFFSDTMRALVSRALLLLCGRCTWITARHTTKVIKQMPQSKKSHSIYYLPLGSGGQILLPYLHPPSQHVD